MYQPKHQKQQKKAIKYSPVYTNHPTLGQHLFYNLREFFFSNYE